MGKIRGRKSNPDARRKQTTREGQGRSDAVQAQPLLRKVDAAEAYARQAGDLSRLRQIARHRERLAGLVADMVLYRDRLAEVDGRAIRTAKFGFPKVAEAGRISADRLRGDIQVMENRYRNMLADIVSDLGIRAADSVYPIDMLHAAGKLVGEGEDHSLSADRCEIGSYFCGLHWRLYGRTPRAQDNGYVTPINPEEVQKLLERAKSLKVVEPMTVAQRDWLDAARYNAMRETLKHVGCETERLIVSVCCHLSQPKAMEMPMLRAGLSRLLDAKMPGRDSVPDVLVEDVSQWAASRVHAHEKKIPA